MKKTESNFSLRAIVASSLICALLVNTLSPFSEPVQAATRNTKAPFPDIKNSPHRESIEYIADLGVVKGNPDGTFRPDAPLSRAEMSTVIIAATNSAIDDRAENCFSDVKSGWFAKYVCAAKKLGFVSGYKNGTFAPGAEVNMAEGLLMATKAMDAPLSGAGEKAPWYEASVNFAHQNNIFSKYSYLPSRAMTRGEMARLVHLLIMDKKGEKKLTGVRDVRSLGCGKTPPTTPPRNSKLNGVTRSYITSVPDSYDKNTPIKLVFAFHGRTNSNQMVRGYYKVEEASNGEAIFVYPSAIKKGSSYAWNNPGDPPDKLRDYFLFDLLLKEFSEKYCINVDQVYVVGHSLGGWFTSSLGCARGNVIRAIAAVGGGNTPSNCTGPVAAMIWHNPKDNLSRFSQGELSRDTHKNQNQCTDTVVKPVEPRQHHCVQYQSCSTDAPLVWCPHTEDYASWDRSYYPHTWPASAGKDIWKFFKSQT